MPSTPLSIPLLADIRTLNDGAGQRVVDVFPDAQILHTLCSQLSWPHLRLIIPMDATLKLDFYIEIYGLMRWRGRQLQEGINLLLNDRYPRTTVGGHHEQQFDQPWSLPVGAVSY